MGSVDNTKNIDATQTLNEFYNNNQNSNYQTLTTINDAFANADYQTAQNINNSLTANNLIEAYQKRVNELLIKYISYQAQPIDTNAAPFTNKAPVLDATELADLYTIANSCFDKYGHVITQARVLMNNVSNTLIEFEEKRTQLEQRISVVQQGLTRVGVRSVQIGTEEAIELYYKVFNPGEISSAIKLK